MTGTTRHPPRTAGELLFEEAAPEDRKKVIGGVLADLALIVFSVRGPAGFVIMCSTRNRAKSRCRPARCNFLCDRDLPAGE
jgi:hypothetical protein